MILVHDRMGVFSGLLAFKIVKTVNKCHNVTLCLRKHVKYVTKNAVIFQPLGIDLAGFYRWDNHIRFFIWNRFSWFWSSLIMGYTINSSRIQTFTIRMFQFGLFGASFRSSQHAIQTRRVKTRWWGIFNFVFNVTFKTNMLYQLCMK